MPLEFAVDDVQPCPDGLPTKPEWRPSASEAAVSWSKHDDAPAVLLDLPYQNRLVSAVHLAFAHHHPLELTPDAVWLTVLNGVSTHVAMNADALATKFGSRPGAAKRQLHIMENALADATPEEQRELWPGVARALCEQFLKVGGADEVVKTALSLRFSTSGPTEAAAMDIALLDCVQSYYSYHVTTLCGFPSVRLKGTREDWASLRSSATELLPLLGLDDWLRRLGPVLDRLVAAFDGAVDPAFWSGMYKLHGQRESGKPDTVVTGRVGLLFPYLQGGTPNPMILKDRGKVDPTQFPGSTTSVPFQWKRLGVSMPMTFSSGIVAVSQDPEKQYVLSPVIGWSVARRPYSEDDVLPPGDPLVRDIVAAFHPPADAGDVLVSYREFMSWFRNSELRTANSLGPRSISLAAFAQALAEKSPARRNKRRHVEL